jgi:hypothetical protein
MTLVIFMAFGICFYFPQKYFSYKPAKGPDKKPVDLEPTLKDLSRSSLRDFKNTRATTSRSMAADKSPPIRTHPPTSTTDISGKKVIATGDMIKPAIRKWLWGSMLFPQSP